MKISLYYEEVCINTVAITDTGHTLRDIFSNNLLIIIDKTLSVKLFWEINTILMFSLREPVSENLKKKFRLISVSTVTGSKLMPSVKLDKIKLINDQNNEIINNVSAVLYDEVFDDDYSCILPQRIKGDILWN